MQFDSEEEKKALQMLVDTGQTMFNHSGCDWSDLASALRLLSPVVYPDFDIGDFLGDEYIEDAKEK